ncbi:6-O-methylguanine DNA methyltransferase [Mrakia frigida]|uniref:MGMT family protein n=1 Tax=Mrakia frigida TaxID=29902 RepID=UPI003FCC0375
MAANMAEFHERVYEIVRSIPRAKVTSYGHVAKLAGYPNYSRHVGQALRFLQDDAVPWHRVLAATGKISHRGDNGEGAERQRRALEAEGVEVEDEAGGGGGGKVNLRTWGWFPDVDAVDGDGDEVE